MKRLHIVQLYINEMNTYGDRGNLLTLSKRTAWQGYEPVIHYYNLGDELPKEIDIVLGGGGQDAAQADIQTDIQRIKGCLHALADDGTPMIMICGCYQLFGHRFLTANNQNMQGISIFDIETIGGDKRLIGNVAVETGEFGMLYGFENHSGRTYLGIKQQPLGTVIRGNGNNGEDTTEGARINNVFGTYMHGPVLPNNPIFTDTLIRLAAEKRYGEFVPGSVNDRLSDLARSGAKDRHY